MLIFCTRPTDCTHMSKNNDQIFIPTLWVRLSLTENKVTVYNSPVGRNNQTENEFAVYVPVLWTGTVLMRKN